MYGQHLAWPGLHAEVWVWTGLQTQTNSEQHLTQVKVALQYYFCTSNPWLHAEVYLGHGPNLDKYLATPDLDQG